MMNSATSSTPPQENPLRLAVDHSNAWSIDKVLSILWDSRFLVLGIGLCAGMLGLAYALTATPIYQAEALLQVEGKGTKSASANTQALITMTEGPYETVTDAMAEIEILRSSQVLGKVVESLRMDIVAIPKSPRLRALLPQKWRKSDINMTVDTLDVPSSLRGVVFHIVALQQGRFRLNSPDGSTLAEGQVGEELSASWHGETIRLSIRNLNATEGQDFTLERRPLQKVIADLRAALVVAEKGKDTNLISLTFDHQDPVLGAQILNSLLENYQRLSVDRKMSDTFKTLEFLQEQLPILGKKLKSSEDNLSRYRAQSGSADLPEAARLALQQVADLEGQLLALRQRRGDLLRTFQEQAPEVMAIDQQISKLTEESGRLKARVRDLPQTQQEAVRLTREVEANQGLYTTMLSNIQELQIAKAGTVSNSRIIDTAVPSFQPIRPVKKRILGLSLAGGLALGIAIAFLLDHLNRRVVHPDQIESSLGIPVVVTIPKSRLQRTLTRSLKRHEAGEHLLASLHPEDPAVESLRSLRTSLRFMSNDKPVKSILFVGASPGVGKSFVSANFAYLLSHTKARVLLIDADLRKGTAHQYCGVNNHPGGLAAVLQGELTLTDAVRPCHHGMHVLTRGVVPKNPSELLMSPAFPALLKEAESLYDFVIFDAPPILAVTDATIIAAHLESVFLVARAGENTIEELGQSLKQLENAGIHASGCVMNFVSLQEGRLGARRIYRYEYRALS